MEFVAQQPSPSPQENLIRRFSGYTFYSVFERMLPPVNQCLSSTDNIMFLNFNAISQDVLQDVALKF